MITTGSWKARPYQEDDEKGIAELATSVYPDMTSDEFLKLWQRKYMASPKGFVSWIAEVDGRIVGHYGSLIVAARLVGRNILTSQAVDAFTNPQWRQKGVFVGLGLKLLQDLSTKGVHITYGAPNKAAMPGHKRLSWKIFAKIPRYVLLLNSEKALKSYSGGKVKRFTLRIMSAMFSRPNRCVMMPNITIVPLEEGLPIIASLWRRHMKDFQFSIERDEDYLSYRYPENNPRKYTILLKENKGQVVAATVCGVSPTGIGQINELFIESGKNEDAICILRGSVSYLRSLGCHTVEAIASTRILRQIYRKVGFIKVSKMLLIVHSNDSEGARQMNTLLNIDKMLFSLGDTDLA